VLIAQKSRHSQREESETLTKYRKQKQPDENETSRHGKPAVRLFEAKLPFIVNYNHSYNHDNLHVPYALLCTRNLGVKNSHFKPQQEHKSG